MLRNTLTSYGSVAKIFHWLIALLIVGMLTVGFIMKGMDNTPDKFKLYGLHKATGMLIFILAFARLGWRLRNPVPVLPAHMNKIERFLAHVSHWSLYALIILMPLSGWVMTSAAGMPVSFYGLFVIPPIVGPDRDLLSVMKERHFQIAWCIIILVSLHIIAALLHHYVQKDNILRRMLPFVKPTPPAPKDSHA